MAIKFFIALLVMASASMVGAQTIQTLSLFNSTNGANPLAPLTLGNDGTFYGTTYSGGSLHYGTVFKVTTNGTLTTLLSFSGANGQYPTAALTFGSDGALYGTTQHGGGSLGDGTVFKVTTNGTLTTLVSFNGTNGAIPVAALTLGDDGKLYGTTHGGGSSGYGTVFKVTTNGTLTTLASFDGATGQYPSTALTLGNDGSFYGTTPGSIFKVATNGALTPLVSFNGANGTNLGGGLALGREGNFYGTTSTTVFRWTTNGALTTLVPFSYSNGSNPGGGLVLGSDDNFYGTTPGNDGSSDLGTVFVVTTNGTLITLASFYGTNGAHPSAGLTVGPDGSFYGTTAYTQATFGGFGTVFRLSLPPVVIVPPPSQTNNAGATVTFLVSATGLSPTSFQWIKNGTNLVNGGTLSGVGTSALTIAGILDSDAATYSVIISNRFGWATNYATLTVVDPPVISAQPTNLLVWLGTNVVLGVALTGSAPLHFQWQYNGTNLLNATNSTYALFPVSTNNAGNYAVVITNAAGSVTSSNAALTVLVSPRSQTEYAGSLTMFTVLAFTSEALNYQWQKNGVNLINGGNVTGATNSTLTIASVSDADAAIYNAVVSDAFGSVTTSNAFLMVNDSPFIAAQPLSQTVGAGTRVTFTATAYGAPPFVFQWSFNQSPVGSPTAGTNVSILTLANVGTNQSGNYTVQVFNGTGSATSSNAVLTVIPQPTLALQMLANYPLLSLAAPLGNNFLVQCNTNVAGTNWINLISLTNLSTSPYLFLDSAGASQPARFYRAFLH